LTRECLDCGMLLSADTICCPKCDAILSRQTDGSTLELDIAHHGERVPKSLANLEKVLAESRRGYTQTVKLIVGHGLIRDAVNARLTALKRSARILHFQYDRNNRGVILVQVRSPARF
jgi:hypothetical protein